MAVQPVINPSNAAGAPGTASAGPFVSGNHFGQNAAGVGPNQGLSILYQQVTLVQNGTNPVSGTIYLPKHSVIVDIISCVTTAFDSATSALLTVGTSAGDVTYAGGGGNTVSVKTAGRTRPTFSTPQSANLLDTGSNEAVVATVTPVGATTAGQVTVEIQYVQTVNWQNP